MLPRDRLSYVIGKYPLAARALHAWQPI